MLTKVHWAIICHKVNDVMHLNPFIHGKRVVQVDLYDNKIVTSLQGEPKTVYTFDSARNKTYRDVVATIKLTNVTLLDRR